MMRRLRRGQAVTEVALGVLVLVPMLLCAIYLAEAAMLRLEATEAATEPLWDATAQTIAHQSYTGGGFDHTAAAIAKATGDANGRMVGHSMVFTQSSAPRVNCWQGGGGAGSRPALAAAGSPYQDGGGISCNVRMTVGDKGLSRGFLDQGRSGFFKEPLANLRRNFVFCAARSCRPQWMALGDWGLLRQGTEPAECPITMDGCTNNGFYGAAKSTYQANRAQGTLAKHHVDFVTWAVQVPPRDFDRVTDFQMSYQGESGFKETVTVVEGDDKWFTTPYYTSSRKDSYANRQARFLGL